jgi:hypothetical protein
VPSGGTQTHSQTARLQAHTKTLRHTHSRAHAHQSPLDRALPTTPTLPPKVTNATLVTILSRHATVATPVPYLVYPADNMTWWPRPDWPAGGIVFRRPVVFVGWSDMATGVDLGNCAGCAAIEGPWGNVTFDSVVLENLGYGDPADPSAGTVSVISGLNLWFFNTTRRVRGVGGRERRRREAKRGGRARAACVLGRCRGARASRRAGPCA